MRRSKGQPLLPKSMRLRESRDSAEPMLDTPNPVEDRRGPSGRTRWGLNNKEKNELRLRELLSEVKSMVSKGMTHIDISEQLSISPKEANLLVAEVGDMSPDESLIRQAIEKLLDFNDPAVDGYRSIASDIGITVKRLQELMKTETWRNVYEEMFVSLQDDPRASIAQEQIVSMVPQAVRTVHEILQNPEAPASIRLNAAKYILDMSGVEKPQTAVSERKEMELFLLNVNVQPDQKVAVAPEYEQVLELVHSGQSPTVDDDVVEAEYRHLLDDEQLS